jgi:hypothetical protein
MTNLHKILSSLAAVVVILDFLLRRFSPENWLSILAAPILSISLLRLFFIVLVMVLVWTLLPPRFQHAQTKRRAAAFGHAWGEFKHLLTQYSLKADSEFQGEYSQLREHLRKDFNHFAALMLQIEEASHRSDTARAVLFNLEHCFSPPHIENWQETVARRIPEELDCFDYLFISLLENCTRPQVILKARH